MCIVKKQYCSRVVGSSSLENLEDLHFLEEQKVELEDKLKLSGKSVEKWRRQYFAKAAQCELEEARFLIKFSAFLLIVLKL